MTFDIENQTFGGSSSYLIGLEHLIMKVYLYDALSFIIDDLEL